MSAALPSRTLVGDSMVQDGEEVWWHWHDPRAATNAQGERRLLLGKRGDYAACNDPDMPRPVFDRGGRRAKLCQLACP